MKDTARLRTNKTRTVDTMMSNRLLLHALGYVEKSRFGEATALEFTSGGLCSQSRLVSSRLVSSRQMARRDCEHETRDCEQMHDYCSQSRV